MTQAAGGPTRSELRVVSPAGASLVGVPQPDAPPHERFDESVIYPKVAATLPGDDPLAAMSRVHQEIFHLTDLLERLVCDPGLERLDEADRSEARRLLYALDAILRLHFAQEEELLATLTTDARPTA